MLLQPLVAPQVPGIQAGVFTSRPELIARDVHTSGPIDGDFMLPGGKTQKFVRWLDPHKLGAQEAPRYVAQIRSPR